MEIHESGGSGGSTTLPHLIQPCDKYKVKLYGSIIGSLKGSFEWKIRRTGKIVNRTFFWKGAVIFAFGDFPEAGRAAITNEDGRFGFWKMEPRPIEGYKISLEDVLAFVYNGKLQPDNPLHEMDVSLQDVKVPRLKRAGKSDSSVEVKISFGEVKSIDFDVKMESF
jgi:hypothetical protein